MICRFNEIKKCTHCKEFKPLDSFYIRKRNRLDGHNTLCKLCHKLYNVWNKMLNRCHKSSDKNYHYYGGRGIIVCDNWRNDYYVFREWALDNGWNEFLQIDRIDNSKGYYEWNCRFVTAKENMRNSSGTKLNAEKIKEVKKHLQDGKLNQKEIGNLYNVSPQTISDINCGNRWSDITM